MKENLFFILLMITHVEESDNAGFHLHFYIANNLENAVNHEIRNSKKKILKNLNSHIYTRNIRDIYFLILL